MTPDNTLNSDLADLRAEFAGSGFTFALVNIVPSDHPMGQQSSRQASPWLMVSIDRRN